MRHPSPIARVLGLLAFGVMPCMASAQATTTMSTLLAQEQAQLHLEGEVLWSTPLLRELYADPEPPLLWTAQRLARLRREIARAEADGLTPDDYLAARLAAADELPPAVRELLATEALGRLAYTLHFGKSNPRALDPNYNYSHSFGTVDPVAWLRTAIIGDDLTSALAALRPTGAYYQALIAALADHRAQAARGGWPVLATGDTLKPGMDDSRISLLRARLETSGDLAAGLSPAGSLHYDDALAIAVKAFQRRHGLTVDGAVGRATVAALNVPISARIDQLRINLERIRWVFRDRGDEFVAVNIAAFQAVYFAGGAVRWRGRAIVGRAYRQTPIFKDEITYLELNPTWTVPPTILRNDLLPKLRRDPGYLREHRLRVIDSNGGPVHASTIDWTAISATRFPYLLRQDPGPDNALGRIKFMFPNPHAVYLHDTPARTLFNQPERVFSSGCIRIEDPLTLAALLLRDPLHWDRAALEAAIAQGSTRRVNLPRKVPILLLYLTAFPDENGDIHFRRDVYDRDAAVLAALDGPVRWSPPPSLSSRRTP